MEDRIRLSYFYGKEADQFSFYKIPKLLFTEGMVITVAKAHKDTRGQNGKSYSGIGGRPPISHPQNCSHECPYGHDKSFCFPCYKKLVENMRKKKETGNGI